MRMKERKIPAPETLMLVPVGRITRKRIRESCEINGVKNEYGSNYVYLVNMKGDKYVFVCVVSDIATYTVITAFNLSENKQ